IWKRFHEWLGRPARALGRDAQATFWKSHDPIDQLAVVLKTIQILEEKIDVPIVFVCMPAGGVRRDEAVRRRPEEMIDRQRLGRERVDVRLGKLSGAQRGGERSFVISRPAADVVVTRVAVEPSEARGV